MGHSPTLAAFFGLLDDRVGDGLLVHSHVHLGGWLERVSRVLGVTGHLPVLVVFLALWVMGVVGTLASMFGWCCLSRQR